MNGVFDTFTVITCEIFLLIGRVNETWSKLIVKLINDRKIAIEMGRRGSKLILDNFSWDRVSEKCLEIYDKVTNKVS